MTLSEEHLRIISEHPLSDTLDPLRDKLRNTTETDGPQLEDVASLLSALVGSTAAFSLPSPDGSSEIAATLFIVLKRVRGGLVQLGQFRPLVRYIVDERADADIWEAVFAVIENLGAISPPRSGIAATFTGTPVRSSSSRLADSETRDVVERELFFEIKDCTFRNVGGFMDKFFSPKYWCSEQKAMLKGIMTAHNGNCWSDFPVTPDEKPAWDWLRSLEDRFLSDAPHRLHTTRTAS